MRRTVLSVFVLFWCYAATLGAQSPERSLTLERIGDNPNLSFPHRITVTRDSSFEALSYTLIYRVGDGPETIVAGIADSLNDGVDILEIPSQPVGSVLEYYLTFQDKYHNIHFLPDGAPQVKYAFRITEPPAGPEHLILTAGGDVTRLYDLAEQRVIGRIYGLRWQKADWSPDGSIVVLFGYNNDECWLHVLDINNFRLLRTVRTGLRLNGYSRPLIEAGNRWAFIPGRSDSSANYRLYRIDLQSGEISTVPGLPDGVYLTENPLLLPEENKIAVLGGSNIYRIDPETCAFTTVTIGQGISSRVFRFDPERNRIFLFDEINLKVLQGEPFRPILERRYSWPMQTPYGVWQFGIPFETTEFIPQKGVVVIPNASFDNYTDLDELVYWDTRDLLEPLQEIKISQMYPFSVGYPPHWPGISASNDNSRLWISVNRLFPDEPDSPGLLQFDFDSRSFVEPIRLTGLEPGEYPGIICAWHPPMGFSSPLAGDLDDNGRIDVFDLLGLLREMHSPTGAVPETWLDLNRDGARDTGDLLFLLRLLGR